MLRDLFFNIWQDSTGYNWLMLVLLLFIICFFFLIFYFVRIKLKKIQFNKLHLIGLGLILIIMYQIIPTSLDFYANEVIGTLDYMENHDITSKGISESIKFEKMAIQTAMIPWQKGGYYCKLSILYNTKGDFKNMRAAQKQAYRYIKSYKYPCWGINNLLFYAQGEYDIAIEIAKHSRVMKTPPYAFISHCYIMKGDLKNAELYIDKSIQIRKGYENLATKAYILKEKGKTAESLAYYKEALQVCKTEKNKIKAEKIYRDFIEYSKQKQRQCAFGV